MVEGDGLENRYTPRGYRGFESLALRHLYFKCQKSLCKAKNNFASKSCKLFFFLSTWCAHCGKDPQERVIFNVVARLRRTASARAHGGRTARSCRIPRSLSRRSFNGGGSAIFLQKKWRTKPQGFSSLSRQAQLHIFTRRQPLFTELQKPCL